MWQPIAHHVNHYWIAQMFLTRLPVPKSVQWSEQGLALSILYFPVVGLIVGLIAAATYAVGALLWTKEIAVILAIAVTVISTGAFHEDGLADSADGIGGAFDLDKKLAIMRDSRIGTYGSVALLLTVMAKVFAVLAIDHQNVAIAFIIAHCLSRWTSLPLIANNHYLREDGTGKPFAASVNATQLLKTTLLVVAVTVFLAQWLALLLLGAVAVFTGLAQFYLRRKLGGITGDTLGAVNSLTELLVYLVFSLTFID